MDIRQKIFEIRGYTPIPFILVMIVFAKPTLVSLSIGFCIACTGEAIRLWGVSIAGTETRTTGEVGASHLFTDGPFGYVRNPLYVGNMMLYFGFGIMANALMPWLLLIAILYFIVQYQLIVSREEEHLRSTFGEEYERYFQNVPRFLPRITPYRDEKGFHREADVSRGIQSERRTLQAFMIVFVLIVLRYLQG